MQTDFDAPCYVGVVRSKAAVTTFDSRLTVQTLSSLNLPSIAALEGLLPRNHSSALTRRLSPAQETVRLTPKLSQAILKTLIEDSDNRRAVERAAFNIPRLHDLAAPEWEQLDAVRTAMAAFGLSKADLPLFAVVPVNSDSTIGYIGSREVHALEDNVIAKDANEFPGFKRIERYVTGRATFMRRDERLDIYTANRGPLEETFGVDLIYINEAAGNTVMVQYKMLEPQLIGKTGRRDWVFRPDTQFRKEIERMRLPRSALQVTDYRLHRDPFFLKFVRRKGDGETHRSFVLSLDHINRLLASPETRGLRGGVRISFESLEGTYLRDSDLLGLIRSGYVGTHRVESQALRSIIDEVANGNRALVLAWQRRVRTGTLLSAE